MKNQEQKTILLVEDDRVTAMIEADMLKRFGYDVVTAKSGEEAVQIATGNDKVALVLMDINLGPGIDGTEAAGQILSKRHLPIVFLTSHTEKEYVDRVKAITRYGYILKASDKFVIQSSIEMAFELFESGEARRASEEHYRSLFDNMLDGFAYCRMIFDRGRPQDFIYLKVNSAFESLTGLKNVVGKKASEVIPGIRESDAELLEIYGRVALTGKPEKLEKYVEALKMWFSISIYSSEKECFVAVFDVITDRKRAEEVLIENEARLRTTLEILPVGVFIFSRNGQILTANAKVSQIWGVTSGVIPRSRDMHEFAEYKGWWPDTGITLKPEDWAASRVLLSGETAPVDIVNIQRFDGSTGTIIVSAVPFHDARGNVTGAIAVIQDITARKQAEAALEKAYAGLEDQVKERTRELQARLTELERFRNATVEREFRMKEMSDEIEKLKAEKHK